jgi:acyl-CoA thioester hydrolase
MTPFREAIQSRSFINIITETSQILCHVRLTGLGSEQVGPTAERWRRTNVQAGSPTHSTASHAGHLHYGQFICETTNIWHTRTMLDRVEFEPIFFAPFVSSVMKVEPAWIDYNGHLNMAYYNVLFDRAVDEVFELLGCGVDYVKKGFSTFTAEVHVRYLRELHEGDPVRVTFQLLEYDNKRMHYFEQLFHAQEGWVSATSENMSLHVDMKAKRVSPFPPEVVRRLLQMKASHGQLPRPEAAGRSVQMPVK